MVFSHVCYTFSRRDLEMKKDMALRSLSREQRELISQTIRLMGEQNNRREG